MNKLVINLLDSVSKNLINGDKINISELKESTVMITGASGFIGSMLANLFLYLNEKFDYNIKLILNVRDKSKLSLLKGNSDYSDYTTPQKEESLCHLDLYKERSSYPVSKRMAEHYCYLYSKEFNVNVVSLRLVQVIGPGVNVDDNRVFNQFAKSVIYNSDIELNTDGSQKLAFIHIADLLEGIFYVLFSNLNGEAINVINSSNFGGVDTIRKLAEYSANVIAKNKIKVCFNIDSKINKKYITSKRVLNSDKFYRLGFIPKITIEQSMKELVSYLVEEGV